MQAVTVRICSITGGGADGREEYACPGKMTEKNGMRYVLYDEPAHTGMEGVRTTLKWNAERVVLLRSGALEHRQEFCRGCTDRSLYRTSGLEIPLETVTEDLRTSYGGGLWRIDLKYTLLHGRQPYGRMQVRIEIEEADAGGH